MPPHISCFFLLIQRLETDVNLKMTNTYENHALRFLLHTGLRDEAFSAASSSKIESFGRFKVLLVVEH